MQNTPTSKTVSSSDTLINLSGWENLIESMSFRDIILLEYCTETDGIYRKMFPTINFHNKAVRCAVCETAVIMNFGSIMQHVRGKKHVNRVRTVVKGYKHPKIDSTILKAEENVLEKTVDIDGNKKGAKILINPVALTVKMNKDLLADVMDLNITIKQNMNTMTLEDLLLVEYRLENSEWQNLLQQENALYKCVMCESAPFADLKAIRQHLTERKHQTNIDLTKMLYHPKYSSNNKGNDSRVEKLNNDNFENELAEGKKNQQLKQQTEDTENKVSEKIDSKAYRQEVTTERSSTPHGNLRNKDLIITPKQKTLSNVLRIKMTALSLDNLKKIEFRYSKTPWKKMLIQKVAGQIKCVLCNTIIIRNVGDMKQHIAGKKHQQFLDSVAILYHPSLANTKSTDDCVLDDKTFRQVLPKLSEQELKQTKFTTDGKNWKNMLSVTNGTFECTICNASNITSFLTLYEHLKGHRHTNAMKTVKRFYCSRETKDNCVEKEQSIEDSKGLDEKQKIKIEPTINSQIQQPSTNETTTSDKEFIKFNENNYSNDQCDKSQNLIIEQVITSVTTSLEQRSLSKSKERKIFHTIELEDSPEKTIMPKKDFGKPDVAIVNQAVEKIQHSTFNKSNYCPIQQYEINQPKTRETVKYPSFKWVNRNQEWRQHFTNIEQSRNCNTSHTNNDVQNQITFSTRIFSLEITRNVEGLIGVEYVVKIVRDINDTFPRFECCLCELEVDGLGMQLHLKGLHHRTKFLERHFPTAMRDFLQFKNDSSMSTVLAQICDKMAVAIEGYHGRDLPFECLQQEFISNRHGIMSKVFSFKHASELTGPSFTDVVNKKTIDEMIDKRSSYKMNYESDLKRETPFDRETHSYKRQRLESPTLDVEEHRKLVEQFLENTNRGNRYRHRSPLRKQRLRSPHQFDASHRRSSEFERSKSRHSETRNRSYSNSFEHKHDFPVDEENMWQTYCREFNQAMKNLETRYELYKIDPENHPLYSREWKKFWKRRTDELIAENRNPDSHNFQPEWVNFFIKRMKELYEEDIESIRIGLRCKLNLEPQKNKQMDNSNHPEVIQSKHDTVFNESDQGTAIIQQQPFVNQQCHSSQMKSRVQEQSKQQNHEVEMVEFQGRNRKDEKNCQKSNQSENTNFFDMEMEPVAVINTVSVLRILTALEDQLGSLGPKVIGLLTKALTLEKIKPNMADESLLTPENCILLETIREKLKGQLLAGVLEPMKIRAVKKAVMDITVLIKDANLRLSHKNELLESQVTSTISSCSSNKVISPIKPISNAEKRELASKLASALHAQGKTDLTTEQLEQLVAVYSMISKKSRGNAGSSSHNDDTDLKQQQKSLSDILADFLKPLNGYEMNVPYIQSQNKNTNPSNITTIQSSQSHNFVSQSSVNTSLELKEPPFQQHVTLPFDKRIYTRNCTADIQNQNRDNLRATVQNNNFNNYKNSAQTNNRFNLNDEPWSRQLQTPLLQSNPFSINVQNLNESPATTNRTIFSSNHNVNEGKYFSGNSTVISDPTQRKSNDFQNFQNPFNKSPRGWGKKY